MSQQERGVGYGRPHRGPQNTPRLRLKSKASRAGHVDGAWWPRSTDLPAELPDLLAVLAVRLGDIARVTYLRAEWDTMPRKVTIDDRLIRLDGYDRQRANTLGVVDSRGGTTTLVVVPVRMEADRAHEVLMSAADSENESRVEVLLDGGTVG